ncbi:MAG: hypothetical protein RI958_2577 [Actinomycetota bacterium]
MPLNTPGSHRDAASFALAVGQLLERDDPRRVTTTMAKVERPGKVFIDWSQNARHKTTIGVYSLRARTRPWASSPVSWGEVERCAEGTRDLRFEPADVLARVMEHGDLFAGVLTVDQRLPTPPGR